MALYGNNFGKQMVNGTKLRILKITDKAAWKVGSEPRVLKK
jgi:hypothetical protein